ncbi:tetratricopeptide repeat protein [uncultured Desulfovibrio sp.]|uniref:tetratricopeptide repeat protein n=1 Tax=uncultured Desulfovibrio sp. TaxID=167968 RepID=UPI0026072A65|nr:tetratricopeptide repeat protein [uncultured Desulfovibrio sp.]
MFSAPREIRDNVARAIGYVQRGEIERALLTMSAALRAMTDVRLPRPVREELHARIRDFLDAPALHDALRPLLAPGKAAAPHTLKLHPGKEAALATVLDGLARILRREEEQPLRREVEERLERKRRLLGEGLTALREGQPARGLAFLRRIVDEFGDEEGIRLQMGQILAAAGMHAEAAHMYEEAMTAQPRDAAAYTGAVAAWTELREYARAEKTYKAILRTFGGHPATFGKMAALYLAWGKLQEAGDAARRALQEDPAQADALTVLAALEKP